MLKIVDVHASLAPEAEYVVLQNHGTLTVSLKGYALCAESYLTHDVPTAVHQMYVFREDVPIKPYTRVVLFSGQGYDGWQPTTDGKQCFVAYWNQPEVVWSHCEQIFLLNVASSVRVVSPYALAASAT